MKKILTHLTGIVFLFAILIAGGCSQDSGSRPIGNNKVEIYCKAFVENGVLKFEMSDSKDDTKVVAKLTKDDNKKLVANHITNVEPGNKVIWIWTDDSVIKKFVKIGPPIPGEIITGNAKRILFSKKLKLKIPRNAPIPSEKEKYDIEFKDKDGKLHKIDPYLKIPHTAQR